MVSNRKCTELRTQEAAKLYDQPLCSTKLSLRIFVVVKRVVVSDVARSLSFARLCKSSRRKLHCIG